MNIDFTFKNGNKVTRTHQLFKTLGVPKHNQIRPIKANIHRDHNMEQEPFIQLVHAVSKSLDPYSDKIVNVL